MATAFDTAEPGPVFNAFMAERHLASLTTIRTDGTPQVTPVGFTYDPVRQVGRVITWADSFKAKTIANHPGNPVAICHIDGGNWLTFYGLAVLTDDPAEIAEAVERYAKRYRQPKERSDRVVIVVAVERIVGRLPASSPPD